MVRLLDECSYTDEATVNQFKSMVVGALPLAKWRVYDMQLPGVKSDGSDDTCLVAKGELQISKDAYIEIDVTAFNGSDGLWFSRCAWVQPVATQNTEPFVTWAICFTKSSGGHGADDVVEWLKGFAPVHYMTLRAWAGGQLMKIGVRIAGGE